MSKWRLTIKQGAITITMAFQSNDNGIPLALWNFAAEAVDPAKDAELNVVRVDR